MKHRCSRERGSALVLVLWISFGLVSLAIYFGQGMSLELKASANAEAGAQAEQAIEGAVRYVTHLLGNLPEQGRLPEPELYVTEAATVGEGFFWLIGRDPAPQALNRDRPYFELIDEAGKLNLNTAQYTNLIELPFMTPELADAIIDWRDSDDEPRDSGAESDVYLRYNPPMTAKNAPFESVEELRLLNGATEELLYGEDANGNGILDANENDGDASPPMDNADGRLDFGIMEYVTVWSREGALQTNGEPRLILPALAAAQERQAATQAIRDWFTENLTEDRFNQLQQAIGQATNMVDLFLRSGNTAAEFAQYDDVLTLSTNAIEGLINVNTASAIVLNTLPGVEWNDAESLVAYRETNPSALTSVAWITEVLSENVARAIGGLITDKGFQYAADIAAVGRAGRGFRRSRIVFDISEDRPKIAYRRDGSRSGWPLGVDAREALLAMARQ